MNPFHGTLPLLLTQLRLYRRGALWLGLLPALAVGAFLRLGGSDPEAIGLGLAIALVLAALFTPLLACIGLTLPVTAAGGNVGYGRRDALLLLPIGRWAVPGAVFAASTLLVAIWLGIVAFGLTLSLGPASLLEGVTCGSEAKLVKLIGACAGGWLVLTSLAAIGNHPASSFSLWLAPYAALIGVMPQMGYDDEHQALSLALTAIPLAVCALVLPFALHTRPRHLWFTAKKDLTARFDGWAVGAALLGVVLFGVGGWTWALGGAALAAAPLAWTWSKAPRAQRVHWSNVRFVHVVCLLATLPSLLGAAALDAAFVAQTEDLGRCHVARATLSPTGRHLALEVVALASVDDDRAVRRVHLLDLSGQQPPRVFPQRFAKLALDGHVQEACWSADGRYLAFLETGLGRINYFPAAAELGFDMSFRQPWERVVAAFLQSSADSVIVDTHTGTTTREEGLLFAPGWTHPEQLVRISVDLSGQLVLRAGTGEQVRLDPQAGSFPTLVAYTGQGPLFASNAELKAGMRQRRLTGSVCAFLPVLGLTADGLQEVTLAQGAGWQQEAVYLGPPEPGEVRGVFDYVLRDGQREVSFPSTEQQVPLGNPVDGRLLVRDSATSIRELNLATGAWRTVFSDPESGGLRAEVLLEDGVFLRRERDQAWFWLRPGDASPTPLPRWAQKPLGWLPDGALLAHDDLGLIVFGDLFGRRERRPVRELAAR